MFSVKNLLWTDKYQPSSSTEVIGNSGSMKKLKTWLSEWKHILDREAKKARKLLMKKNKGKLQKTQGKDIYALNQEYVFGVLSMLHQTQTY